jgi:hypothetical protein
MLNSIIKKVNNKSLNKILLYIIIITPLIFLSITIRDCKVDVPYGDQWDFIQLLEKSYQGKVSISDLTIQHNEHRFLFPRMIWLFLAHITDWNIGYELVINVLLAILIFITLSFQIKSTMKSINSSILKWTIPILSLIIFSLNQWENWLWGWQISLFLSAFSVILGIIILSGSIFRWSRFILAIFLGTIAVYSFANGVVYWIIGIGILFLIDSFKDKKQKVLSIIIWGSYATLVMFSYLYNYHTPEHHPSIFLFLSQPVKLIKYFLTALGSSLIESRESFIVGFLGMILFIFLTFSLLKSKIKLNIILPYISIALYAITSALLLGIGRFSFGYLQALSPRYTTFSNFFWIAIVVMIFLYINHHTEKSFFSELKIEILPYFILIIFSVLSSNIPGKFFSYFADLLLVIIFIFLFLKIFNRLQRIKISKRESFKKSLCFVLVIIIIPLIISRSYNGTLKSIERNKELKQAKAELFKLENKDLLKMLYPPNPAKINKLVPILKKRKLSLFREK